jgi:hypothetical protein
MQVKLNTRKLNKRSSSYVVWYVTTRTRIKVLTF